MQQSLSRRQVYERNTIADYGLNLQHKFSDRVEMNLDANWTDSSHDVDDMSAFGSTFAAQELDITGKLPVLISHKPTTLAADCAVTNPALVGRSAEPKSEIQALMRLSYAVSTVQHKTTKSG